MRIFAIAPAGEAGCAPVREALEVGNCYPRLNECRSRTQKFIDIAWKRRLN
jgi:hypothetical protein